MEFTGAGEEVYYEYAVLFTGLSALTVMIPMIVFYRRDKVRRIAGGLVRVQRMPSLNAGEGVLLLLMGAAYSMFGNMLMASLQIILDYSSYQEDMEMITSGKSMLMLIFWMGIVAPVAEEMIFRWNVFLRLRDYIKFFPAAVVSGVIFGVYHGNILQAVYASILGIVFAYILERSGNIWSCVLLHIGANVWSLLYADIVSYLMENLMPALPGMFFILFLIMAAGTGYFERKGKIRGTRTV